ncbi:MAG: MaoC family dehydratase N-terminal domain-containing protein [Bdellovibrionales bacterium]|nr:MaoC family dehydratase N-terminal domain-containing protein [Bdellovibrionales bacterium]
MSAPMDVPFLTVITVTREHLREYAAASGDQNPIHLDDELARANGLPGVIAHGMLTAGLMAERSQAWVKEVLGAEWEMSRFNTRFRSMVFPGDEISIGGLAKPGADEWTLDLKARNQKGEAVVTGSAAFRKVK